MENLRDNKLLMYAIIASSTVVVLLTTGFSPELNSTFKIITFPDDVSKPLVKKKIKTNVIIIFSHFSFRKS